MDSSSYNSIVLFLNLYFFNLTPLTVHLFLAIHFIGTNTNIISFLLFQFLDDVLGFLGLYALFLFKLFAQGILELIAFGTFDCIPSNN